VHWIVNSLSRDNNAWQKNRWASMCKYVHEPHPPHLCNMLFWASLSSYWGLHLRVWTSTMFWVFRVWSLWFQLSTIGVWKGVVGSEGTKILHK
jgi:hypothetical protein